MRTLITGADGLIGRAATTHLVDAGHDVVAVYRDDVDTDVQRRTDVQWIARDLSVRGLDLDMAALGIDAVVHLAAIPSPGVMPDDELLINNSVATSNLLFRAAHAGVERFVLASSVSIYGYVWSGPARPPLLRAPLSEADAVLPADGYALTKQVDEAAAAMYARRYPMSVASLRFPNVSTAADAVERRRQVMADASVAHRELWAYLTLEDAARAIERALLAGFSGHVAANIVSAQSLFDGDIRPLLEHFYPEAVIDVPPGTEQCGYEIDVARDILGFAAERVLPPISATLPNSKEKE